MIHFSRVHDISILLGKESVAWPGDPPYERELISAVAKGGVSDVSRLTMSAHCGTHLDTPAHFIGGGRGLDGYRAADFILPAIVVDAGDATTIGPGLVNASNPPAGGAKLVRVVLPAKTNDLFERIVSVFSRQVAKRCPARVTTQGEAPLTVALALDPAIGSEGFRITGRPGGGIEVAGQNERADLLAADRLMRWFVCKENK